MNRKTWAISKSSSVFGFRVRKYTYKTLLSCQDLPFGYEEVWLLFAFCTDVAGLAGVGCTERGNLCSKIKMDILSTRLSRTFLILNFALQDQKKYFCKRY